MNLGPLRFELTTGLLQAGRHWQRLVEEALRSREVSASGAVPLLMIGRSGGGIRQVALADQVGVRGPSLVRVLDKLCAAGLVRRGEDAADRRAKTLWLTERGAELVAELERRLTQLRAEVLAELPQRDLEAVLRLYRVLAEANARIDNRSARRPKP
ncbi:MAG TPA: MarR family transcriptional regulator [Dokdonella sp.]